jgi:hypothetical protein
MDFWEVGCEDGRWMKLVEGGTKFFGNVGIVSVNHLPQHVIINYIYHCIIIRKSLDSSFNPQQDLEILL